MNKSTFLVVFFFLLSISISLINTKDLTAPDNFKVKVDTTKGVFYVNVTRSLSPHGVDRFYTLIDSRYYDNNSFFRVIKNFVDQFGISSNVTTSNYWRNKSIKDDPVIASNTDGWLTFATSGKNSRTTQLFFNTADNSYLDDQGFTPFGFVFKNIEVIHEIYSGYDDLDQSAIYREGSGYLSNYPKLDYINTMRIIDPEDSSFTLDTNGNDDDNNDNTVLLVISIISIVIGIIIFLGIVVMLGLFFFIRYRNRPTYL
eukprot:TRINITY_DN166_c0_g1_i1.p1 TRINITY_DN166_c0_g1~~TRINITY_DN166_c0_g1_i1.p1  ORF type:complete len:271 (+),score=55.51 TRINITY_DN166_c0_g1_i1:44-814(+)